MTIRMLPNTSKIGPMSEPAYHRWLKILSKACHMIVFQEKCSLNDAFDIYINQLVGEDWARIDGTTITLPEITEEQYQDTMASFRMRDN